MILSSPHVHTQFCDGRSTAEEMVLSALTHGCRSLGFSSHARQNFAFQSAMSPEAETAYIAEVRRLQKAYADKIRIWLGVELDSYSCADTAPYDYIIGSVHYLPDDSGFIAIDGASEPLCALLKDFYKGDGIAMARDYYLAYGAMMRARRPQIGGHFDLLRKWNKACHLFDEDSPLYRQHALHALEAAYESGVILEVNTGGMARYSAESPYPSKWQLEAWHEMGGEVILASDCHYAPDLLSHYNDAVELLRKIGYEKVRVLGTDKEVFEDTELEPVQL